MKHLPILLLLLSLPLFAAAQGFGGFGGSSGIKGKITGEIVDASSKEAVEFATIVLQDQKTGKEIDGIITDEKGAFKLTDVKLGTYKVMVSFLGYETLTIDSITLTKKEPDFDLEKVQLKNENVTLEEVVVTEEASLYENRIDKIVYNAEKDATVAGGDATDVLRNTPLLSVDLDGNVSLRGSQNIQILINGRPSSIFASSVADALKTIPADQIKSVEVVTSPGAKYDGEGSAGIINIITKKKQAEGFTGSVNTSIGNVNNNAALNLSAAKGRFGVNANGGTRFSWEQPSRLSFIRENFVGDQTITQSQIGEGNTQFTSFYGSINAFYDINAFQSVTSNFRLNGRRFARDGLNDISFIDPIQTVNEQYQSIYDNTNLASSFDWSTDYKYDFEDSDQEFTIAYQLSGNIDDRENDLEQLSDIERLQLDQIRNNDGLNLENTFQIDYVQPVGESIKLETGVKAVIRDIESDYDVLNQFTNDISDDPFDTNIFNYNQDVYAGYVSMNIKFGKKYGLIAGVRYENTTISGDFENESVIRFGDLEINNDPFEQSYDNWLPSITIARNFKNFQSLKASYSRRIQRPSLFFINPYSEQSENRNLTIGAPTLNPEVSDQIELSYNTFVKGVGLNGSVYYKRTTGVIENYTFPDLTDDGVSVTSFRNIGENNSFGANLFTSATFKRKFTIRGSINVFTYDATGEINGQRLSTTAVLWNGFGSASYDFKEVGLKIEAFGFYRSPNQTLQGITPSFSIWGMGLRKDVLDKKGSLGLRVIEPFAKFKRFGTDLGIENQFRVESEFDILFRSIGLTFQYKFGELSFQQRQRRSKIKNSDQKSGGDGQQQGGGGFGG